MNFSRQDDISHDDEYYGHGHPLEEHPVRTSIIDSVDGERCL